MRISFVCLLIISLFAIARSDDLDTEASTISIDVFDGSNAWWIALAVRNANDDTQRVLIKDSAPGATWAAMDLSTDWGYWTHTSGGAQHIFPVSVQITSKGGSVLTFTNLIYSAQGRVIDTGLQYDSTCNCDQQETTPTVSPTSRPAPTTHRPSHHTTPAPTTARPTSRPTSAPTTNRPTSAPTTTRPTSAPTTARPTAKPTSAPTTASGGCGDKLKLLVPLYTYPGSSWDSVATGASSAQTVAIINPNSGPGTGPPDSNYISYMQKLHNAGVEIVGYVHTSYGGRSLTDVQADIDSYVQYFPLLVGIFLDEASDSANDIPYYTTLYNYIMRKPGWKYDILNPGTPPAQGYLSVSTQIVAFEDVYSHFSSNSVSYANCNNRNNFAVIGYAASSSQMGPFLDQVKNKGYYGWVFVTDGAGGCCTYNNLASYYASEATYVGNQ